MDAQSLNVKAPVGIAKLAKEHDLPVIAIVGSTTGYLTDIYDAGIDLIIDIVNKPMSLDDAIKNVKQLITNAGETAITLFCYASHTKGSLLKLTTGTNYTIRIVSTK